MISYLPQKSFFVGFKDVEVFVDGVKIHAVVGGTSEPLLLLHGAPQSHVMWRELAPQFAREFTVIAADLRGYGRSDNPKQGDCSKKQMAQDQMHLMAELGFDRFFIASHDRGSHVARRLAKDHPQALKKWLLWTLSQRLTFGRT